MSLWSDSLVIVMEEVKFLYQKYSGSRLMWSLWDQDKVIALTNENNKRLPTDSKLLKHGHLGLGKSG